MGSVTPARPPPPRCGLPSRRAVRPRQGCPGPASLSAPYRERRAFPGIDGARRGPLPPVGAPEPARDRAWARVQRGRLFPASPLCLVASGRSLGERRLADRNQQVMADFRSKCIVLFLKPDQGSLQVSHTLLKAAHFRDHARIRAADVAEYSLRHCKRSSTLSDQSGRARDDAYRRAALRAGNTFMVPPRRVSGQVDRTRRSQRRAMAAPGRTPPAW